MSPARTAMLLGLLAALLAGAQPAAGQEPPLQGGGVRRWTENSEFALERAGKPVPEARLYNAQGKAAVLVVIPGEAKAIVIDTAQRAILTADAGGVVAAEPPDRVDLDDAAIGGQPAPFTMDKDAVVFFLDGSKYRLARRPPLLGPVTLEAVLAHSSAYRKGMEEYSPAPQDIVYLSGFADPVRIEVYFGSWCPHCRIMVPRFLKSIQAAANGNLQCVYTGVPSPFSDYPPAKEKQVQGVPTFIIYSGDREIGRIGAFAADSSIEHELVKVLYQWKQSRG